MDGDFEEMEMAEDWEGKWAWWEVFVTPTFCLEQEKDGDKGEERVEQDVLLFHGCFAWLLVRF